jgi:hypothetical protein
VVAPPPNLTAVAGTVLDRRPSETLPDWDVVTLAVDDVSAVPGLRDLIGPNLRPPAADDDGTGVPELAVAVRRELLGDAAPGWRLRCRVRLTPNGAMAESHPAPFDIGLEPPDQWPMA